MTIPSKTEWGSPSSRVRAVREFGSPSAALQITYLFSARRIKTEPPLLSRGKSVPASLPEPGPAHLFDHLFSGHFQSPDKSAVPAAVDIVIDISRVDLRRNCEGLF